MPPKDGRPQCRVATPGDHGTEPHGVLTACHRSVAGGGHCTQKRGTLAPCNTQGDGSRCDGELAACRTSATVSRRVRSRAVVYGGGGGGGGGGDLVGVAALLGAWERRVRVIVTRSFIQRVSRGGYLLKGINRGVI